MERYVAVQEPTCTWAVFDIVEDVPAEFEGRVLIGLGKAEAMLFASAVNARKRPPAALWDAGPIAGRLRSVITDEASARRRKLPLDDKGDAAEKNPARTWRNW